MTDNVSGYLVSFESKDHRPVRVPPGSTLSEVLNISNSPLLFGCRTGICGTCLIEIISQQNGELPGPSATELELLEIIAPGNPRARLACQLEITGDIAIRYLGNGS